MRLVPQLSISCDYDMYSILGIGPFLREWVLMGAGLPLCAKTWAWQRQQQRETKHGQGGKKITLWSESSSIADSHIG